MKTVRHETATQERALAVLAEPELVDALRLAGIERTRALRATPDAAQRVQETLREWLADESLGVVIIGTAHAALAAEMIRSFRHGRRPSPVIVQVPSRDGEWEADARAYYQALGREFIGLELVLRGGEEDAEGAEGAENTSRAESAENTSPAESAERAEGGRQ